MSNQQVVDLMEHVWSSIESLCSSLNDVQWKTPTDCPGWSVQDQISHLVGAESDILGNPRPDHTPENTPHVKNDVGESNEVVVDFRRSWTGHEVLEEFRVLTELRMEFLKGLTDEGFAAETQTEHPGWTGRACGCALSGPVHERYAICGRQESPSPGRLHCGIQRHRSCRPGGLSSDGRTPWQ